MEQLPLWITPALVLGLFALVRFMFRDLKENMNARMTAASNQVNELKADTTKQIEELKADTTKQIDELRTEMRGRFAEMNQRFDQVNRELADNRERMAKLEGSLEGFLAGRRDRDAA